MDESNSILDENVVYELKRVPTDKVIRYIFPDHPVPVHGVMRSPFHRDRHPSFSCFKGKGGFYMWKDHSSGEYGDNIALYQKAFPNLSFVEAVDGLSLLVLGKSAVRSYAGGKKREYRSLQARKASFSHTLEPVPESHLKIVSDLPLTDASVPDVLRDYWRGRGISDKVMSDLDLRYIIYENTNRRGMTLMDPVSGLPLIGEDGRELKDDGRNTGIGMYNDIGGVVLRSPDTPTRRGFKGTTYSFISTFLADGSRPARTVSFVGEGSYMVNYLRYDSAGGLQINPTQSFRGLAGYAQPFIAPMLEDYVGSTFCARDIMNLTAVMNALNAPSVQDMVVVEGMFDGLSEFELQRIRSNMGSGKDLVIANSISNLKWAVPFICRHSHVSLMLDNDYDSGAGQKAYRQLCNDIESYGRRVGSHTVIFNASSLFEGYKDLNEALMADKGFPVEKRVKKMKDGAGDDLNGQYHGPSM